MNTVITAISNGKNKTKKVITNQYSKETLSLDEFLRRLFEWNKATFIFCYNKGDNFRERCLDFQSELFEKGEAKCKNFFDDSTWEFKLEKVN